MGSNFVVRDVSMNFGGVRALDGLSFDVDRGLICGLIGPNGAGKTTLFNVVSRIYRPDAGELLLGDLDLLKVPAHRIAHHGVTRTFQNLGLFPTMSILENTMAGAHAHSRAGFLRSAFRVGTHLEERRLEEEAWETLEFLELADVAHQPARDLPFGTLKQVELARALAAKPTLLLLDEPAGGLTHREVDELAEKLRRARDRYGLTMLLVEHHMAMVLAISDKVVAMDFGKKLAEGTPDAVRNDPAVIEAYLGTAA